MADNVRVYLIRENWWGSWGDSGEDKITVVYSDPNAAQMHLQRWIDRHPGCTHHENSAWRDYREKGDLGIRSSEGCEIIEMPLLSETVKQNEG